MARIVVIDDDENVRNLIITVLETEGHEVVGGCDGQEAELIVRGRPADLLILDILMPNQDGLETILGIRRSGSTALILAMSAGGLMDAGYLLQTAKAFGADDILVKPFQREGLLRSVNALLGP